MTSGSGFSGFGAALKQWVDRKVNGVDNALSEVADDVSKRGEEITKHHIETRGTAKSGKRGRVETGNMRDSVSSRTTRKARQSYQAEFGWIGHAPDYARYQEPGFTHRGGNPVEGMYALNDAADEVLQDAREDLRRKIREL